MKRLFAAILFFCVLSSNAFSQSTYATLGGTVQDVSGAFIPGVSITATNTGTGIVNTVVSNDAGAYQFASLQTGTYTVTAELPGFQTPDSQRCRAWSVTAGSVEFHHAGRECRADRRGICRGGHTHCDVVIVRWDCTP